LKESNFYSNNFEKLKESSIQKNNLIRSNQDNKIHEENNFES